MCVANEYDQWLSLVVTECVMLMSAISGVTGCYREGMLLMSMISGVTVYCRKRLSVISGITAYVEREQCY